MKAVDCLLSVGEVQLALGHDAHVEIGHLNGKAQDIGGVIRAAAADSAYRAFSGQVMTELRLAPLTLSELVLVFATSAIGTRTFDQVAQAAHLRTTVDGCQVAVETATSSNGMISYWAYLHLDQAIVVLALDTIDAKAVSIADLRGVVTIAAARLRQAVGLESLTDGGQK